MASSSGEHYYTVLVSPWAPAESICEDKCRSYRFRGRCRHQEEAARRVCRWDERSSPQQQTDDERKLRICPKCGGPTRYEMEVIDDDAAR